MAQEALWRFQRALGRLQKVLEGFWAENIDFSLFFEGFGCSRVEGRVLGTPQLKYPPTLVEKTEPNQKEKPWFWGVNARARTATRLGWDPLNQGFFKEKHKGQNGKR